ncbi:hypothetical protein J6O86_01780 [bacterium]|nr:hypothetical protein [bacterium]
MIPPILTNPAIYNITQTTQAQVAIETGLKAVGRPGFILLDNSIDNNTKKYSSMKEFLYQLTCMVVSLGVVIPVFKKGSFAIARKLFKDEAVFQAFKKSDDFNKFRKLTQDEKISKLNEINSQNGKIFDLKDINENLAKGMIEVTSIAGSILGLSILSPLISRPLIRPVLKSIGLGETKKEEPQQNEPAKVDIKA